MDFDQTYLYIDTNTLFKKCVDKHLIRQGVIVHPSPYYQKLANKYKERYQKPMEADFALNKDYVVLDLATTQHRKTPPILSIPSNIKVNLRDFNRK